RPCCSWRVAARRRISADQGLHGYLPLLWRMRKGVSRITNIFPANRPWPDAGGDGGAVIGALHRAITSRQHAVFELLKHDRDHRGGKEVIALVADQRARWMIQRCTDWSAK